MKRRWLGLVSLLAAFSLVIAACGDDDTSDTTAATTAETTATTAAATTTAAPATTAAEGSDIAKAPTCSPEISRGRYFVFCSSFPFSLIWLMHRFEWAP